MEHITVIDSLLTIKEKKLSIQKSENDERN